MLYTRDLIFYLYYTAIIHPYYSVSLQFICLGYYIIFHILNTPQFIYLLSCSWVIELFLGYCHANALPMNIIPHEFYYTSSRVSLGFMPRSGIVEL